MTRSVSGVDYVRRGQELYIHVSRNSRIIPCGYGLTHIQYLTILVIVLELLYKVIKSEIVGARLGHLHLQTISINPSYCTLQCSKCSVM